MAFDWDLAIDLFYIACIVGLYWLTWFFIVKPYFLEIIIIEKLLEKLTDKHAKAKMFVRILAGMLWTTATILLVLMLIDAFNLWENKIVQSGGLFASFWVIMALLGQAHYGLKAIASLDLFIMDPFELGDHVEVIKPWGDRHQGVVSGFNFRATVIDTDNQDKLTIPNDILLDCEIINHDANKWRYETIRYKLPPCDLGYWGREILSMIDEMKSEYMIDSDSFTKADHKWYGPRDEGVWKEAIHPKVTFDTDGEWEYLVLKVPVRSWDDGSKFKSEFLMKLSNYIGTEGFPFPRVSGSSIIQNNLEKEA